MKILSERFGFPEIADKSFHNKFREDAERPRHDVNPLSIIKWDNYPKSGTLIQSTTSADKGAIISDQIVREKITSTSILSRSGTSRFPEAAQKPLECRTNTKPKNSVSLLKYVRAFLGSITSRCSGNDFTLQIFSIVHYFGVVLNSLISVDFCQGKWKLDFRTINVINDC